jgi:phage-related protein
VDKPRWTVEISPEIETWYASLKSKDKAMAGRGFDRLAEHGPALRMPHARPPGSGLNELRFTCEGTARRVTYYIDLQRRITTLTTFRKQRQNERREVAPARQAMRASQGAGGTDG